MGLGLQGLWRCDCIHSLRVWVSHVGQVRYGEPDEVGEGGEGEGGEALMSGLEAGRTGSVCPMIPYAWLQS